MIWTPRARRRPAVLALVDLAQDADVLAPILVALRERGEVPIRILVSRWLERSHPRTAEVLRQHRLGFRWVRRSELPMAAERALRGAGALITASESSHPAHAAAHALARLAKARGLATFTVQHGLENIGLLGEAGWDFASSRVLTWHPPELTASLPRATREKLEHVGRAMLPIRQAAPPQYDVGVFENLHADHYGEAERNRFEAGLAALAASGARVLLKPHPAGQWSAGRAAALPANVELAAPMSGAEAIASVRRVITTPSTVVLDAALLERPVALALPGSALTAAFPVLETPEAWTAFAQGPDEQQALRGDFLARMLVPGDAGPRIAAIISRVTVAEKL